MKSKFFQGLLGRRKKAAFVLIIVWGIIISLYFVPWGIWIVYIITTLLSFRSLLIIITQPTRISTSLPYEDLKQIPSVSLLVAIKNEETVIRQLVTELCGLDYVLGKYDLWIVNDHSTDKTVSILNDLAQEYPQLNILLL